MKTVKDLIKELQKFPEDAMCYGYEGENTGIGIKIKDGKYGFIYACELEDCKESETEILITKRKKVNKIRDIDKKQQLCQKIIASWDEMCCNKPDIVSSAKTLQYFFVNEDKKKLLTLSLKELMCMDRDTYFHFQKKNINAEDAMAAIGLWAFRECDDSYILDTTGIPK